MARLANEIIAGTEIQGEETDVFEELPQLLATIPIFVMDNVNDYAMRVAREPSGRVVIDPDRFPNLAPPFEVFWMEYRGELGDQTAGLFAGSRFDDPEIDWGEGGIEVFRQGDREAAWLLAVRLYGRVGGSDDLFYAGQILSVLGEDGSERRTAVEPSDWFRQAGGANNTVEAQLRYVIYPMFVAISFLHCRNVVQVENAPNRAERRRAQREGTRLPVTYKTLVIEPIRRVLESEGKVGQVGLAKALHICRGHFRHYEEKPLFGKLKGTYFIPAHIRGSGPHVVHKQYEVRAESRVSEISRQNRA
jgi:hypothetical protein